METVIIHLDECEPDGKGWTSMELREALKLDDTMPLCSQTDYMREELYADEPVWVERTQR